MGNKWYERYLSSEHWKKKRSEVLLSRPSASFGCEARCHICLKEKDTYDIHHLTYERIGNENRKDIVQLCKACHRLIHYYQKEYGILKNERIANRRLLHSLRTTRDVPEEDRMKSVFKKMEEKGFFMRKKRIGIIIRCGNDQWEK